MAVPLDLLLLKRLGVDALVVFALTTVFVAITVQVCNKQGWVAKPRSDRWHKGSPAFFGGVPIWCGFIVTALVVLPLSNYFLWKLIAIATVMFLLGLLDDIFHFRAGPKLAVQILAALLVLSSGVTYHFQHSMMVNQALSLIWIVGITNAFNLLDNMDGLSSGVALISSLYLIAFFAGESPGAAVLVSLLAGAIGGFLLFNFCPAKIFMGDAGSLFIGFMLATVSLLGVTHVSGIPAFVLAPMAVLAIPLLDTFFVAITRRLRGQAVSIGGTDHSSHRLVRLGLHERIAVLFLYCLTAFSGAMALIVRHFFYLQSLGLIAFWYLFLVVFGIHLFRSEAVTMGPHSSVRNGPLMSRLLSQENLVLLLDPIVLSISYYLAYFLRFWASGMLENTALFLRSWPLVVGIKFSSLYLSRVYKRSWWRGSVVDVYTLARAALVGEALSVLVILAWSRFVGFSRLVFILDFFLSWALLFGIRKSAPLFRDSMAKLRAPDQSHSAAFVLGTSEHAEIALKFLSGQSLRCAGLIDLNGGADLGKVIWGMQVVGHWVDLPMLVGSHGVTTIIVPENEPMPCQEEELLKYCTGEGVEVLKLGLSSLRVAAKKPATISAHV